MEYSVLLKEEKIKQERPYFTENLCRVEFFVENPYGRASGGLLERDKGFRCPGKVL
jgi:hypothetical protein